VPLRLCQTVVKGILEGAENYRKLWAVSKVIDRDVAWLSLPESQLDLELVTRTVSTFGCREMLSALNLV
jgi:hypothetical protein